MGFYYISSLVNKALITEGVIAYAGHFLVLTSSVGHARSHAERDAVDGISRDFGVGLLPTDPEDHKGVGRNGGGGVDGFPQPALRSTLVEFHRYLYRKKING